MNSDKTTPSPELARLLSELLDGRLDDAKKHELRELLRNNPAAQDSYRNTMALHALLHLDFSRGGQHLLPPVLRNDGNPASSPVLSKSAKRFILIVAAMAACVAAVVGYLATSRRVPASRFEREAIAKSTPEPEVRQQFAPRDVRGVAVLAQSADAKWSNQSYPLDAGAPLPAGRFKLDQGLVQLEFFSGATIVVEAPADFELVSSMQVICNLGKMRAKVPTQAQGFAIETPKYSAVDLGTEFTVAVESSGESEIHVLEGEVELWDRQHGEAGRAKLLTTGNGVRAAAGGQLAPIVKAASNFIGSEQCLELSQAALQERFKQWQHFSDKIRSDRHVQVYYGFDGHEPWERVLRNNSENDDKLLDGAIVGCHWTTGRWNGKQALEFKRTSDRVRVNVPGEFDSLTFAAWVRIEGLERWLSSLMLTDGHQPGEVHWQMTELGQLMLGVKAEPEQSHDYYSPSVIGPIDLGRWVHLGCVYNGPEQYIAHYVDGVEVSREDIRKPTKLHIGAAEVGNWVPEDLRDNRVRSLNGRMDEFFIMDVPLAKNEMREVYEAGKPQ